MPIFGYCLSKLGYPTLPDCKFHSISFIQYDVKVTNILTSIVIFSRLYLPNREKWDILFELKIILLTLVIIVLKNQNGITNLLIVVNCHNLYSSFLDSQLSLFGKIKYFVGRRVALEICHTG